MKKLEINYGSSVLSLPEKQVIASLPSASELDLKVLLLIASDKNYLNHTEEAVSGICRILSCNQSELEKSVEFWKNAGVFSALEKEPEIQTPVKPKKQLVTSTLPSYSEKEAAEIIENATDLKEVIDICQNLMGKIFTSSDVNVIIGMYEHLGVSGEYIVTLVHYLSELDKKTMRYVEKTAVSLFDEGVCNIDSLNDYIRKKEAANKGIIKIRSLMGIGDRKLTAKEKKLFTVWLAEWGFTDDIIGKAYEITVDKIHKPSVDYMNKILDNWHSGGFDTLEKIEASIENYRKNKSGGGLAPMSFDIDEFFEAALARSYKKNNQEKPK